MELNYKSYGAGDPLIILHGLFGSLDNWATFGRGISEHFMTFLVDQRDHGKSPHTEAFNYDLLASDLVGFMEENWIHTGYLMGHSMGGKTVMTTALTHPDMVEKLIIVDMSPKQYTNRHTMVFDAMKAVPLNEIEHRKDAQPILMEILDGDMATTAFLLKNIKRLKEGGFRWKMNIDLLEKEYENIIAPIPRGKKYEGPTMFIRGGNSSYITEDDHELIYELFPNARIETIADAGHWVHAEKPKELMEVVSEFLL